uniref:BAALC binder of MAP3K1 and KLF4 n=1 Tax=Amazona collaria TaxID=241587 RepID=A0A8B9F6J1_9PSIT
MGCGGSRADAIEPRYYESWTRETESTWLTNTDSESPPQEGGSAETGGPRPGLLEDGKSAQTAVTAASATAGTLNTEKRNNCGSQCVNPMVHGTGATTQRQNGFRTAEVRVSLCSLTLRSSFNQVKLIFITNFLAAVKLYLMP